MECFSLFLYIQNQIRNKIIKALTRSEGHFLELIKPLVSDLDCLLLADNTLSAVPLLGCVVHDLLKILRVKGVEYIEKIIMVGHSFAGVFVLEIKHELVVILEVLPQVFDGQLFEMRNVDIVNLLLFEKSLFVVENLFQEILVALAFGWTIILNYREVSQRK